MTAKDLSTAAIMQRILAHHNLEMGARRVDHIADRATPGQEWCRIPEVSGVIECSRPQCYEPKAGSHILVYPLWTETQQRTADNAIFREHGIAKRIHEEYNAAMLVRKDQYPGWSNLFLANEQEALRVTAAIVEYGVPYDTEIPEIFKDPKAKKRRRKKRIQLASKDRATCLEDAVTHDDYCRLLEPLWDQERQEGDDFMGNWLNLVRKPGWFVARFETSAINRPLHGGGLS